ncbi:hypothetical protein PhCBS80983_g04927 [Powellomyces hirtus]|uniref:Ubiquitin carboxyl-terminal hydrolase n=1 Tax=Powellomyces hirtus TaxID=109895 RepID=A0A507DWN5_9FUNG|nr:hypothetical protein PhCBS80983_g04927 [Powellomyces hirtus]
MVQKTKAKKGRKPRKSAGAKRTNSSSALDPEIPQDPSIAISDAESNDESTPSVKKCSHLKACVRITRLSKQLPSTLKKGTYCMACRKDEQRAKALEKNKRDSINTNDARLDSEQDSPAPSSEPSSLWLCLKCGQLNCGRNDHEHALKHFEDEAHAIAINVENLECWCYSCDTDLVGSSTHNQLVLESKAMVEKVLKIPAKDVAVEKAAPTVTKAKLKKDISTPGLTNLGNTCFFNSVMQCINYTTPLWQARAKLAVSNSVHRPVSDALLEFLDAMKAQRALGGGSVNPRSLFGVLSNEWRMYKRMGQQDSHELLRRLLDGVREEQLDRSPGRKPGPQITPVDEVFGGKLCQIIVCDTCKHISYAFEDYLDLSLPIKDEVNDSWGLSSLFSRRKSTKSVSPSREGVDDSFIRDEDLGAKSQYAKDPDNLKLVKMLLEPTAGPVAKSDPTLQQCIAKFMAVETLQGDSVYSCDTCFKLKYGLTPAENRKELEQAGNDDSSLGSGEESDSGVNGKSSDAPSIENAGTPKITRTAPDVLQLTVHDANAHVFGFLGQNGPVATIPAADAVTDSGAVTPNTIVGTPKTSAETLVTLNDLGRQTPDAIGSTSLASAESANDGSEKSPSASDAERSSDETRDAEEVPSGCQKRPSAQPAGASRTGRLHRPPVQTRAYKRYLMHTTPEVLVVHLKRFQQVGFGGRTKKVEDVVAFEYEMDVSSFLAPPEVEKAVKEGSSDGNVARPVTPPGARARRRDGKYRLYGVVVHGGGLFSGHYVAYVRVGGTEGKASDADEEVESEWAYCSDTHVRPSSWEEVSKAQAYILMYERLPTAPEPAR